MTSAPLADPVALHEHLVRPTGICMLAGEFPPDRGGVGDYTARLSEALAGLGLPVGVMARKRKDQPARRLYTSGTRSDSVSVPVQARIDAWDARAWPRVCRALSQLGPRPLLHIQFQAGAFDLGGSVQLLPTIVRNVLPRARVVTTFHDFLIPYLFPKAGPLRLATNRLLARTSHAAIFTDLADLEQAGPGIRGHVVPIGSNLDLDPTSRALRTDVRRLLGADEQTFLVGYFGFLNASKGVPTLLEATARLKGAHAVRLALIGAEAGISDPTDLTQARAVHDAIERLDLGDLVVRTGYLPPSDLSATLFACDALALPFVDGASARRGTLMAALAHGLPTVSTRPEPRAVLAGPAAVWLGSGPSGVAVRDGEAILLVPPDDPTALAEALARLADHPDLRARLASGANAVAARISWPALAEETAAIYSEVFARP